MLTNYHPCSAERQEIRGLNLPGPPWAISTACCGIPLPLPLHVLTVSFLALNWKHFVATVEVRCLVNARSGTVVFVHFGIERIPSSSVCLCAF